VATLTCCENEDVCGSGLGFSAFGFLFSRLPLCSRFAIGRSPRGSVSALTAVSIFMFTDNGYFWEGRRTFFSRFVPATKIVAITVECDQ
jgi:hypothetical protein